jgi:hypothetical protein
MRNAATHNGKDLAREIALLKEQLDELAESVNGTDTNIFSRSCPTRSVLYQFG